jgi:hypothetical protein
MTALVWAPGVCAPTAWPLDGATAWLLPQGATFAAVTVTSYAAVAADGGASVITHERPVLLTISPDGT